jgi:hypothetical protein
MTAATLVAHAGVWRARFYRLRDRLSQQRHQVTSAAMVVGGMAGALGGGALIGRWALGLVLIAESVAVIWLALERDDGVPVERAGVERTPRQILEVERRRP